MALRFAFGDLALDEVLSFTAVGNDKSRRVMEKIGMTHDPADDFDHPNVAAGHRLERHVLYRILPKAAPERRPLDMTSHRDHDQALKRCARSACRFPR